MALLLLGATACNDIGSDQQEFSYTSQLLNKAIEIADITNTYVSTSNASLKWTYNNDTRLTMTTQIAIDEVTKANFTINDAVMEYDATRGALVFTAADGGAGITQVKGYFNPGDFTLYLEFVYNGTHKVTSVAQLSYPYVTASMSKEGDSGEPYVNESMGMVIVVNPATMKAKMRMLNFRLGVNQPIIQSMTFNEDLTVTSTESGYVIEGTDLTPTDITGYTINDFHAIVTHSGLVVTGEIKANDIYTGLITGKMFVATP